MDIQIKTKFDIGQEVYTCYKSVYFKDGDFVDTFVPDKEPRTIKSVTILKEAYHTNILYSFVNKNSCLEDMVFNTLEEAQKWCDKYE